MKYNKSLLSALFLGLCAFGQHAYSLDFHVLPQSTPMEPMSEADEVGLYSFGEGELAFNKVGMTDESIVEHVKAIWILGSDQDLEIASPKKKGVHFSDVKVSGGAKKLNKRLSTYVGKPLSKEDVISIKQEIAMFCQEPLTPPVVVTIPEQDVESGVVKFVVQYLEEKE